MFPVEVIVTLSIHAGYHTSKFGLKTVHSESWLILEIVDAFWILNDLDKHVNIITITFNKYFSSLKIYNAFG